MEAHRVRFIEYNPAGVSALAATPPSSPKCMLAVGRSNGDIEIRLPEASCAVERFFPGGKNLAVSCLSWAHQSVLSDPDDFFDDANEKQEATALMLKCPPRLFSGSLNGIISEWGICSFEPKATVDAGIHGIWCVEASPFGTMLAAGGEDGSIVLYNIADDEFEFVRRFAKHTDGRTLSLAWHPSSQFLVSGCELGALRRWEPATGRCQDRTVLPKVSGRKAAVWCVAVIPKSNAVVAATSNGSLEFFDLESFTLTDSVHAHDADVLALISDPSGTCVFSCSVDRKVAETRCIDGRWMRIHSRCYHAADVTSIALIRGATPALGLYSGSLDTEVVYIDLQQGFLTCPQRRITEYQVPRVKVAASRRLLLARTNTSIKLYELGVSAPADGGVVLPNARMDLQKQPAFLAEIKLSNDRNIGDLAVSSEANWIAVAHSGAIKLWRLLEDEKMQVDESEPSETERKDVCSLRFIRVQAKIPMLQMLQLLPILSGGHMLLLGVDTGSSVQIYNLETRIPTVLATISPRSSSSEHSVTHLAADANQLAIARKCGEIAVYDFSDLCQPLKVFCFTSPVTSVQWTSTYFLVALSNKDIFVYERARLEIHAWCATSQRHARAHLAKYWDHIRGGFEISPAKLVLWSTSWTVTLDLSRTLANRNKRRSSKRTIIAPSQSNVSVGDTDGKENTLDVITEGAIKFSNRYTDLMHVEKLGDSDIIVFVERPWSVVIPLLPAGFNNKRYGL